MFRKILSSLISFYIISLQIQIINASNICGPEYFCDECQYCGQETMVYSHCSYYNTFCKTAKNTLIYSSFFIHEYDGFFNLHPAIASFCGQGEYILSDYLYYSKENEILLFSSENKSSNSNMNMHCHYYINAIDAHSFNPRIVFERIRNTDSKERKFLKYRISSVLTYNYDDSPERTETFSYSYMGNLQYAKKEIVLDADLYFEVFVDFLEKIDIDSNEVLRIKIFFDKNYEKEEKAWENIKEEEKSFSSSSDSDSVSTGEKAGGISVGTCILFLIICCCWKYCCRGNNN